MEKDMLSQLTAGKQVEEITVIRNEVFKATKDQEHVTINTFLTGEGEIAEKIRENGFVLHVTLVKDGNLLEVVDVNMKRVEPMDLKLFGRNE